MMGIKNDCAGIETQIYNTHAHNQLVEWMKNRNRQYPRNRETPDMPNFQAALCVAQAF